MENDLKSDGLIDTIRKAVAVYQKNFVLFIA